MLWWILDCDIWFSFVRFSLSLSKFIDERKKVDSRRGKETVKVWTKRRKINNPYRGTLSSYGYVLLVIHFLSHVKQPAVVPFVSSSLSFPLCPNKLEKLISFISSNLQRLPIPSTTPLENLTYEGHDIGFFDDIDLLPSVWQAQNGESTGELLIDFFRYFANTFDYTKSVISIRSEKGTLGKEEKGWNSDVSSTPILSLRRTDGKWGTKGKLIEEDSG